MDRRKNNQDKMELPLSKEKLKFYSNNIIKINKKIKISIFILIILFFIIIFRCSVNNNTKRVFCSTDCKNIEGWISAETNSSYWVVDNYNGEITEINKYDCSVLN